MPHLETSRRGFLQGSGALVVSFALSGRGPAFAQGAPGAGKTVALNEVDGFLAIGADGRVTVFSGKVDLGTGVRTALTQMAAEELDVPLDRVTVIQGDTALTPDQGPTYGSLSVQSGGAVTPYKQRYQFITAYIPGLAGLAERESILAQPTLRRQAASGDAGGVLRNILLNPRSRRVGETDQTHGRDRLAKL